MELGTLPDWIIAAANICMAATAVYAAINAKDWLAQKKHEQAMLYAITLINDDLYNILRILNAYSKELPESITEISSYKLKLRNKFKVYFLFRVAITSLNKIESLSFALNHHEEIKENLINHRDKIHQSLDKINEYANENDEPNLKGSIICMDSVILALRKEMTICRMQITDIIENNKKIKLNRI